MTDNRKYSVKRCNNAIAACDTLMANTTAEGRAYWAGKRVVWMDRLRQALKDAK